METSDSQARSQMSIRRPIGTKAILQKRREQEAREARAAQMAGGPKRQRPFDGLTSLNAGIACLKDMCWRSAGCEGVLDSSSSSKACSLSSLIDRYKFLSAGYLAIFSGEWKGICAIGAFLAFNISLNNTSMLNMTLSLNQVIRSSLPILTCIIAFPVEGKLPKPQEMVALVVLSLGIMTCVWRSDAAGSVDAMSLCLLATMSNSAMSCFAGKVMSEAVDALQLIFLTAPISLLFMLPYPLYKEMPGLVTEVRLHAADSSSHFATGLTAILIGTSIVAIVYNYVHAKLIHSTSATTTTVIGQVKIVGLVLASAALLGESSIFDLRMIVGSSLACIGFAGYSFLRLSAKQNHQQAESTRSVADIEKGSDIKQELLDPEPDTDLIKSASLPRKR